MNLLFFFFLMLVCLLAVLLALRHSLTAVYVVLDADTTLKLVLIQD